MQFNTDSYLELPWIQNVWYQIISAQYHMFLADTWVGVIIEHFSDGMIAASISIEPLFYQSIVWSRQQDLTQLNILWCKVCLCKLPNLLSLVIKYMFSYANCTIIFTWSGFCIVNADHNLDGFLSVINVHFHSFS